MLWSLLIGRKLCKFNVPLQRPEGIYSQSSTKTSEGEQLLQIGLFVKSAPIKWYDNKDILT